MPNRITVLKKNKGKDNRMDSYIGRCIYHYPHPIDSQPVGSGVRPLRMLNALKDIGYYVDEITGYGKERKEKIKKVIDRIKSGVKYDFLYSESLTDPTLLAEKNHLPVHPIMDYNLWRICQKYKIPVGLFYRDIYWKYPVYKKNVPIHKRCITIPLYYLDLTMYQKYVSVLFCPTEQFANVVDINIEKSVLPPGCIENESVIANKLNKHFARPRLSLFYVGSIQGTYDISIIFEAVQKCEFVELIVCTPKEQWDENKKRYRDLLCDRVKVVHRKGSALIDLYEQADASLYLLRPNEYLNIASPIKCKETVGYGTPMIVSRNTGAAEGVEKDSYGWTIDYDLSSIMRLFKYLYENPDEIKAKTLDTIDAIGVNTWDYRAKSISKKLLDNNMKGKLL